MKTLTTLIARKAIMLTSRWTRISRVALCTDAMSVSALIIQLDREAQQATNRRENPVSSSKEESIRSTTILRWKDGSQFLEINSFKTLKMIVMMVWLNTRKWWLWKWSRTNWRTRLSKSNGIWMRCRTSRQTIAHSNTNSIGSIHEARLTCMCLQVYPPLTIVQRPVLHKQLLNRACLKVVLSRIAGSIRYPRRKKSLKRGCLD